MSVTNTFFGGPIGYSIGFVVIAAVMGPDKSWWIRRATS